MDIEITTGSEFGVSRAAALTEAGEEFVDSWMPTGVELTAVDAGIILFPDHDLQEFVDEAEREGLTIDTRKACV